MEEAIQIQNQYTDEVSIAELFSVLWKRKYWILSAGIGAGLLSILIVLAQPNVYRSDAILSSTSEAGASSLGGMANQLGSLASLAGVNFGGRSGLDNATLAIETLKSRVFLTDFIKRHELVVPIMAAKAWDTAKQEWVIDPDIFNTSEQKWIRKAKGSSSLEPSDLEVYKVFSQMVSINQDKKTQIITLSVESLSPVFAQKWANDLILDINAYIKQKDVQQAEKSIKYLSDEINATAITYMQTVLYQLIEEQKKTVMLASVRDGYVFQVIDPPVIPEEKTRPKRAVIVVLSLIAALLVGVVVVLIENSLKKNQRKHI